MQKKTTLKDFKVFLLKAVLSILVLGISFQVSFAQNVMERKAAIKAKQGTQVKPVVNPVNLPVSTVTKISNGNYGSQSINVPMNVIVNKSNPAPNIVVQPAGSATDVPSLNQTKTQTNPGTSGFVTSNPGLRTGTPTPTPNGTQDVCVFNGSLVAGDLTMSPRPFRDGVPGACPTKACAGTSGTGPYFYDTYTMQNLTCIAQCVTVNYIANAGGGDCFVSTYNGSFNPTNLCLNRMSDGGSSSLSGGAAVSFTFTVAINQTVVFVVNGAQVSTACPSYTMTVTGLNCSPPPPCTPPTSSILSQVGGPPVPTNLFNETFNTVAPLPAGWASQNLSAPVGATGWFQGNTGVFAGNTPPGYIAANFNNTTGTNIISNWLFAPNVNLKNGDKFSFYTRTTTGAFPDRLQVRMSTNGASVNAGATNVSVGDFSTLLLDINPTYTPTGYPLAWTQYTLTMSGLPVAGISGRIAFRYFVEGAGPGGANSDYIGIDDAKYTTFSPGPVVTCTGSVANLKVDINGGQPGATYNVTINRNPPGGAPGNFTVNNYTSGDVIPVSPAVTTTYSLVSVVQSDNPCCIGTGNAGTPTITVLPATIGSVAITAAPDAPLCAGDPTLLDVISGIPLTNWFLTQSANQNIVTNNSVACTTGPNNWWRAYNLASYPLVGNFTLTSVNFRVEQANAAQTVTANVYNQTGAAFPGGTRTLLATQTVAVPAGLGGTFNATFAVPPVVPNNAIIAVELIAPAGGWWIGSNTDPETAPSYLAAIACGITVPTTLAAIGFPTDHILLNINGTTGGASGPLPPTWTVFWSPAAGLSSTTTHPVAASPMVTTTYTVLVTDPGTGCNTSASKQIVVRQLPAITANPSNTTVCSGATATFTAAGTAAGATYQWQISTAGAGGPWSNLANGAPYSGVTTQILTINPTTVFMNGYRYRMVVSGLCPPPANSLSALLTVNALPIVTLTPPGPICGGVAGINGVLITAGSAAIPIPGTLTVTNTTPAPVADNTATPTLSTITIPALPPLATIVNVKVVLNMSHTYPGDMIYNLKAPNGNILSLYKYAGGSFTGPASGVPTWGWYGASCNMLGTVAWNSVAVAPFIYNNATNWKADALNTVVAGVTIQNPTGFVSAANSFNDLTSVPNGVWTMAMCDGGPGDVGTLSSWSITIDYTTPGGTGSPLTYTWAPAAGLYTNPGATIPYVALSQTNQVYAAPVNNTLYTVTASDGTTGCQNTGTIFVTYTPAAPTVNPPSVTMCLGDAAVGLQITSALVPVANTTTYTYAGAAIPIVDNTPAGSITPMAVPLPTTAGITNMQVAITATHTWDGDVVFVLKAPNGKILNLDYFLSGTGGTGATTGFTNTKFSSTGTAAISTGANPYGGTYKADAQMTPTAGFGATGPTGNLANTALWTDLYSIPNGNWSLGCYDGFGGDFGSITAWSLTFDYLYGPPAAGIWTPNGPGNGLYTDAAALNIYNGAPANQVYTRPATSTVYSVTVTNQGNVNYTLAQTSSNTITAGNSVACNAGGITTDNSYWRAYNLSTYIAGGGQFSINSVEFGIERETGSAMPVQVRLYKQTAGTFPAGTRALLYSQTYSIPNTTAAMFTATLTTPQVVNSTDVIIVELFTPATPGSGFFIGSNTAPETDPLYLSAAACGVANPVTVGSLGFPGMHAMLTLKGNTIGINCTSTARLVPVTVNVPVAITVQPVNAVVCTDKVITFSVTATGTSPTYQWQVSSDAGNNWSNITNSGVYSGATTSTLTITAPPTSMNGYLYRVIVTGAAPCGSSTSLIRSLTVNPLPTITITPAPYRNLWPGLRTTISSTVSPLAATYTWLRSPLGGGTTAVLANPSFGVVSGIGTGAILVDIDGLGVYSLRVTDVNGCVNTSSTVTIADSLSGRVFIYPNPNSGLFQVRYNPTRNNALPRGIHIYNSRGQKISTQLYPLGLPYARMNVNLSNMGSGVYWIEVFDVNENRLAMGRAEVLR